jgi:hypothetical protein
MAQSGHHHHDHGPVHAHAHVHVHAHVHAPLATVVASAPSLSLLRASAAQRLLLAAGPLACLWGLVWWAIG